MRVCVATRNRGKLMEIEAVLASALPGVRVLSLEDRPQISDVDETGTTFEQNALLKALHVAQATGLAAIADDSGLEVDCLDGFPGVASARWAGPYADDAERNRSLIERVRATGTPPEAWTARFVCVMALVTPSGEEGTFRGVVEGRLIAQPRGTHGFGYDPIFLLPELGKTTAELTRDQKNAISHRGRALAALAAEAPALLRLVPNP